MAGKNYNANRLTTAKSGVDGSKLGAAGGVEEHTLTAAQMPLHSHNMTDHVHGGSGGAAFLYGNAGTAFGTTTSGGSYVGFASFTGGMNGSTGTGSAGSDGAHPNAQPTIIVNVMIKL
jgi:microcystin-dependent protein